MKKAIVVLSLFVCAELVNRGKDNDTIYDTGKI